MPNPQQEALLAKWLDNALTQEERQTFEHWCIEDKEFAAQVQVANQVAMTAEQFDAPPLPNWDRNATFGFDEKPKWWQWQGLPAMSFATSAFAIVLVVSGFKFEMADGRLSMGFGSGPDEQQVAALVDEKINAYQQANQALFTQYVDALASQQQKSSAELTQYLLSSARTERREDFAELVKFINEQRSDDQRYYARQINHLREEIDDIGAPYPQAKTNASPMNLTDE